MRGAWPHAAEVWDVAWLPGCEDKLVTVHCKGAWGSEAFVSHCIKALSSAKASAKITTLICHFSAIAATCCVAMHSW